MNKFTCLIFAILLGVVCSAHAQQDDTSKVEPPLAPDPTLVTPADSSQVTPADTVVDRRKLLEAFEARQHEFKKEQKKERAIAFTVYDTLVTYFTSPRLDQRLEVQRSFYKTAGDYFASDPSFFLLNYLSTPTRTTVQPYGLRGDRLGVVSDGTPMDPFEHVVEPDGMIDMGDIPTALDHNLYILPGPVGEIFGAGQSVATLLTKPETLDSLDPHSALLVDKGSYSYNYVRGRYSKLFTSGKRVDLSIGYRSVDGQAPYRNDNASQYSGKTFLPIGSRYGIRASGHLYDRHGSYKLSNDFAVEPHLTRARSDRAAKIGFERYNSDHNSRTEIGYSYLLQGSDIDKIYKGRFQNSGNGLYVNQEKLRGDHVFKAEVEGKNRKFSDGFDEWSRKEAKASVTLARTGDGWRYAAVGGGAYVKDFKMLPFSSLLLFRDRPKSFIMASIGYSERAPSLYELHLRSQHAALYSTTSYQYADSGNAGLRSEKQATANVAVELGTVDNNVRFSATGGRITDGIDWQPTYVTGAIPYLLFSPVNHDIDFYDFDVQQKLQLSDLLHLKSGGAYRHIDNHGATSAYQPKYQAFSGLELHVYWPQRILHLFAYGEIRYVSEYDGYLRTGMGKRLIANAKLSFQMKKFRFHFVFENVFNKIYYARENFDLFGRYNYFGFTWKFAD